MTRKTIMRTETEPVLSPVRATGPNVCTTFGHLIRATIETEVKQVGRGWWRSGVTTQEAKHPPQYSQKSHPLVSSQPDLNILSPVQNTAHTHTHTHTPISSHRLSCESVSACNVWEQRLLSFMVFTACVHDNETAGWYFYTFVAARQPLWWFSCLSYKRQIACSCCLCC